MSRCHPGGLPFQFRARFCLSLQSWHQIPLSVFLCGPFCFLCLVSSLGCVASYHHSKLPLPSAPLHHLPFNESACSFSSWRALPDLCGRHCGTNLIRYSCASKVGSTLRCCQTTSHCTAITPATHRCQIYWVITVESDIARTCCPRMLQRYRYSQQHRVSC